MSNATLVLKLSLIPQSKVAFSLLISKCYREKPVLTTRWNCFFDLLFIGFIITVMHNGLPQRTQPLCLTVKQKCLVSSQRDRLTLPCEKKISTYPFPEADHSWRCFASLKFLSLYFPTASPSLFCLLTLVPKCFSLAS